MRPRAFDDYWRGGYGRMPFQSYRDTNIEDPNIDTIISIGVMGSGKSTLSNILCLRDDQAKTPNEHEDPLFPVGSGETAASKETKVIMTSSNYISCGRRLRVIDPPGLNQNKDADQEHIRSIIKFVKDTSKYIKLFMIVFNGKTRGKQQSTMDTIAIFQEVFGDHFWTNACVVVTHFSRSPEQEEIRKAQGITKQSKKEAILNAII